MTGNGRFILNAATVDLEDWLVGVVNPNLPVTARVLRNVDRVLEILDRQKVRATFFVLGKVAERFGQILPAVQEAGHEIATHGYGHELVFNMTPERFREDLTRSLDIIESQTGRRPIGYRAPGFSITDRSLWALPVLADCGIRYSSSVFPIRSKRYGIPHAPRFAHRPPGSELIEMPMSTVRRWGRNLPVCGGGYSRLVPAAVTCFAIREINNLGHPAVVYIHPYELDTNECGELRRQGWDFSWKVHLKQALFRGRVAGRLRRILGEFRFGTMAEVLGLG